ncbi:MAG: 2-oxoacid:acceptor oxidoreductase family protein [Dehalococcoidales bacterium]
MESNEPIAIRLHGRGGQGTVTMAELVAQAAIGEGKYAQAFPSFGPERRGAPVQAYIRIDDNKPIRNRAGIVSPDIVVVLDPGLLGVVNVTAGLKEDGMLIVNTRQNIEDFELELGENQELAVIDATAVARETLGVPIVNTTMIGALIKAKGVVNTDAMLEPLNKRFGRLAEKNINAMQKAYETTLIKEKKTIG